MHSLVHAFLTHPRSPGGDTVPENRCWQTADRKNSQCFNRIVPFIGVYGSKFTKLSTLVKHHRDCLP